MQQTLVCSYSGAKKVPCNIASKRLQEPLHALATAADRAPVRAWHAPRATCWCCKQCSGPYIPCPLLKAVQRIAGAGPAQAQHCLQRTQLEHNSRPRARQPECVSYHARDNLKQRLTPASHTVMLLSHLPYVECFAMLTGVRQTRISQGASTAATLHTPSAESEFLNARALNLFKLIPD